MDTAFQAANSLWHLYLTLPLTTQAAVTILLVVGFLIHTFAYNTTTVHDAPSLFTTAGIFFTFLGIAEGLYAFNPNAIEQSVPALLEGLKTAFMASVVGVGLALSIKLRHAVAGEPTGSETNVAGPITIDDLHRELVAMRQALVGADDSTLLSQLKLSRQDSNDRLDAIRKAQSEFMQQMAKSNSEALIEALQQVIKDFNVKLTEQFGENFKQLNEAVGRLLEWQERYRTQLDQLIDAETVTSENMRSASEHYSTLVAHSQSFKDTAHALESLLLALNVERESIEASARSLGQLLATTSEALPQMENKIIQLTEQMTFGVKYHQDEITKAVRDASSAFQASIDDVKSLLLQATQSYNQEVNSHIKQLSEKTTEQLQKLDVALEKELTKSLSTLGSQLASLSKQFVDDYGPLTQRLRELVQAARVS